MSDSQSSVQSGPLPGPVSRVRRGPIGIVGTASSPWREVRVRVHDFTGGVSRVVLADDADDMARAIADLDHDANTTVVVVVLPAGASAQLRTVLDGLDDVGTPVVVCAVGAAPDVVAEAETHGVAVHTRTKPAALAAVVASGVDETTLDLHALNLPLIAEVRATLDARQRHVRGLFREAGVREESAALVRERHGDIATDGAFGHALLLFAEADDLRAERLMRDVLDPEVGAVLLDFPLGDGAGPDPVGALLPAIGHALEAARATGHVPAVLGYVQGTELDPQDLDAQVRALVDGGVIWASSATNAALLAREMVAKG